MFYRDLPWGIPITILVVGTLETPCTPKKQKAIKEGGTFLLHKDNTELDDWHHLVTSEVEQETCSSTF